MSATDRPITSPLLVGRAREAERLETSLQLARQGAGQAVLLVGEAGVGKSRLVAETRLQAAAARWTCLVGYCFEGDRGFAYAPLVDALRAFFAAQPATVVAESLGPFAAEVVKLLPELSLAIPEVRPTPAIDPEAEKRRLHEALLHFFLRLAQKSPLLIILEDLHWCDETSLEFFHLLARRSRTMPILLLATYRREEFSASLAHLLAQLDRERLAQEIVLQPLAPAEVDAMVRAIFELQRPVRSAFLDTLCTLTEGNPFFVEEVLKTLVVTGDIFYAEGQWDRKPLDELRIPRSVQDAVQRRTSRLSPAAHRVLSVAAVAGRRFDFSLLQALTGDDEVALLTHIKELMTAQLVVEATAEQFAFRHALTRQAIYAGLLVRERKALHRAIAETMVRMAAPSPDHSASAGQVTHLTALAYHFFAGEVWDQALVFAQAAGQQAQALYAPLAAVEHLTRALEAVDQLAATTPVQNSAAVGARLYRTRGLAYETLGDFEAARADLVAALRLAQQADDRLGQWQALLDLGELWASRDYRQTGDYFRLALQLARTLEDASILARSLNRMGNWCINTEREHEGLHHHQAALEIFQRLNDPPGLAATHDLMGAACLITGNHVHAAMHLEQSAALFRQLQDRRGLASTLAVRAISNETYTIEHIVSPPVSVAASIREAEEALQIAREIGWRAGENYALLVLARVIVVTGGLQTQPGAGAAGASHRPGDRASSMAMPGADVARLRLCRTAGLYRGTAPFRTGGAAGTGERLRVSVARHQSVTCLEPASPAGSRGGGQDPQRRFRDRRRAQYPGPPGGLACPCGAGPGARRCNAGARFGRSVACRAPEY
jgi:tetratricopeptide (TPR) repeat protein